MISPFLSTAAMSDGVRISLARTQRQLAEAQLELSSGRHADMGLALGAGTSRAISLRVERSHLEKLTDTNSQLASKLEFSQSVLKGLSESAGKFLDSMIAATGSSQGAHVAQVAAEDTLKGFISSLNATYNGEYIFGGVNASVQPIADYYESPAPANKAAVDTAFLTQFGISQADPNVKNLSASDVQTFLDGPLESLFDSASWKTTWSSSSDENAFNKVSPHETIETPGNANAGALRKLGEALTIVADLGVDQMNDGAQQAVLGKAIKLVSSAIAGISGMRAEIGVAQDRVEKATDRMSVQIDIFSNSLGKLESIDAAEAVLRINTLSTQMETSFALAARLSQLSLVKYL